MEMENMREIAVAVTAVGLVSLLAGVVSKLAFRDIGVIGSRAFSGFTAICFLVPINLLLLGKES